MAMVVKKVLLDIPEKASSTKMVALKGDKEGCLALSREINQADRQRI